MKIKIITLFPDAFSSFFNSSILKRAQEQGAVEIECIDFRTFTTDKHHKVDDTPYGGGAGMLLSVKPIDAALEKYVTSGQKIIFPSPRGTMFNQTCAEELSKEAELIFVCGHYEGFDERIYKLYDAEELSIGDYVLSGGESATAVICDAIIRLLPGVLGDEQSHQEDSHSTGLLEHPHYTRPVEYKGLSVPEVLRSGNHEYIRRWRFVESVRLTYQRRKDLLERYEFTKEEQKMLYKEDEEFYRQLISEKLITHPISIRQRRKKSAKGDTETC